MPHKKAKRSARGENKKNAGSDLVPTGSSSNIEKEEIPKSMIRVLNAAKIREVYRRKRKQGESPLDGDDRPRKRQKISTEEKPRGKGDKGTLIIEPGEKLGQFNRRVEETMRGPIKAARRRGDALGRSQQRSTSKDVHHMSTGTIPPKAVLVPASAKKLEFARASTKRLNDVADAPPTLTKFPRNAEKVRQSNVFGKDDILPPEYRRMMELEREKAIMRYRELKELKRKPIQGGGIGA